MKLGLILVSIISVVWGFVSRISEMNSLKQVAEEAYLSGNYPKAVRSYQKLKDDYKAKNEQITINLAHALYLAGEREKAIGYYSVLLENQNQQIQSLASNQLGIISYLEGNTKKASEFFKSAIIANPSNLKAVYNFELLNSSIEDNSTLKKGSQQGPPDSGDNDQKVKKEQTSNSPNGTEGPGTEKEESGKGDKMGDETTGSQDARAEENALQDSDKNSFEKEKRREEGGDQSKENLVSRRLKNSGMSPEKAYQILEAMNVEEQIYLQQIKRKSLKNKKNIPPY